MSPITRLGTTTAGKHDTPASFMLADARDPSSADAQFRNRIH
jgi:hypothetical protein